MNNDILKQYNLKALEKDSTVDTTFATMAIEMKEIDRKA